MHYETFLSVDFALLNFFFREAVSQTIIYHMSLQFATSDTQVNFSNRRHTIIMNRTNYTSIGILASAFHEV